MNYYIQGNKDKADQIKAAFKTKGCVMHTGIQCDLSDMIYFSLNGKVGGIKLRNLDLFKTHPDYKELELPKPKFKVGDWAVTNYGKVSQVVSVDKDGDGYTLDDGVYFSVSWCDMYHLWTIADAKEGDVLVTTKIRSCPFIYRKTNYNNNLAYYYAGINGNGDFCEGCLKRTLYHFGSVSDVIPATKEQRDLLFAKMKEAGYEWDANKKKLRKIKPHYDISNFNPFDKVLVRQDDSCTWGVSFFGRYAGIFICCSNVCFTQCIPFDGNEHLLGTTDMCDKQYINW